MKHRLFLGESFDPSSCASFYSPLAGMNSPEDLCLWAKKYQLPGIALTDTNALHGAVHFNEAAKKLDLIPLIGAEVVWSSYRFVVLCSHEKGYEQLCYLLTDLKSEGFTEKELMIHLTLIGLMLC